MLKRIVKILIGLALVPFCVGFTWQFATAVFSVTYLPGVPYVFVGGAIAYLTIHLLFKKPLFSYVIGHELTHALFAVLSGGSIKALQASERGGRVTVTKSNFLITLAPYFFPLYTVLALLGYGAARAAGAGAITMNIIIFLNGAAFSFHLALTFIFLHTDQSDIREQGALFSYPLIYLFNLAFAALLLNVCLAADMDYLDFFVGGIMKSTDMIAVLARRAYALIGS